MKTTRHLTKLFALFILSAIIQPLVGQNLTKSTIFEGKGYQHLEEVLQTSEGFFAFRETGKFRTNFQDCFVDKLRPDLKIMATNQLKLERDKSDLLFVSAMSMNDKIYVFTSFPNMKKKIHYLFVQTLDQKNLVLNDDLKKIAELDFSESRGRGNYGAFSVIQSPNKKYFTVSQYLIDQAEGEQLLVFDSSIGLLGSFIHEVKDGSYTSFPAVTNDGKLYFAETESKEGKACTLYGYSSDGNLITQEELNYGLDDGYRYCLLRVMDENNIIIASQRRANDGYSSYVVDGFYTGVFNLKDNNFVYQLSENFEEDYIDRTPEPKPGKKQRSRRPDGIDDLLLREISTTPSGRVYLSFEQYSTFKKASTTTTRNGATGDTKTRTSYKTYYNFDDLLTVSISPKGEYEWTHRIKRNSMGPIDELDWMSYFGFVDGESYNYVYNDDPKNMEKDFDEVASQYRPYSLRSGINTVLISINNDGEGKRTEISNMKKDKIDFIPRHSVLMDDNSLMLFSRQRLTGLSVNMQKRKADLMYLRMTLD
ncbi:MAG: hypothetical protein MRZ79_26360 [Bacteroidia bacterium]|nr:hypothetical protein [Bacteroidia bacterium]